MDSNVTFPPLLRSLIAGAAIVIILAGMKAAAPIVNLILLSFLLAQSVLPLPLWLIRRRFKPGVAVLLTLLVVVIGGVGLITLLGSSVAGLIEKLPVYQQKLGGLWESTLQFLSERGIDPSGVSRTSLLESKQIVAMATGALGALAGALGNAFVLLFITIFMLIEVVGIETKMNMGSYDDASPMQRFVGISKDTRKYVAITGIIGFAQAAINTIALAVMGVDFAVTFGVFFFFCNFVPAVGFFIALIPPVLIALLDYSWKRALAVLVVWWVVNFVFDNILKPRYMGQSLDIPVLHIILGLVIWSWVLGPAGAVLAIPLTMTIMKSLHSSWKGPSAPGA